MTQTIRTLLERTEAIHSFPVLKTLNNLRQFLVILNYYKNFIPYVVEIIYLLTNLQGKMKNCSIELSETEFLAFNLAKEKLSYVDNLTFPNHGEKLSLVANASTFAMGAVFQQHLYPFYLINW